jgi:hypothetical protein
MMKSKCSVCKKKINVLMKEIHTCRCQGVYCRIHLHDHNCTFNYHEMFCKNVEKNLPVVKKDRVEKI